MAEYEPAEPPSRWSDRGKVLQERQQCDDRGSKGTKQRKIAYVFNEDLLKLCDELPKVPKRASMVHKLIAAYNLLPLMRIVNPRPATCDHIKMFHSEEYVDLLKTLSEDDHEKFEDDAEMYGLTYDCPAYPGVHDYASYVVGASLDAARVLTLGKADIAINWTGGWHHAKRDEACGFCYYNDIVIAILHLRKTFERVLYVDLDLHHGDGVEDAFSVTTKVMTVSFHKSSPGFFPGTGRLEEVGLGRGKYYAVNVPLRDGIKDERYFRVFKGVIEKVRETFRPDAVVCQCGADGLSQDPMASYNLTPAGLGSCVQHLMSWQKPLLLLGGGGYNLANTARCWTYLTGLVLGKTLSPDIPEHDLFPIYGPDFELNVPPGNRRDLNDELYLKNMTEVIYGNLSRIGN